MTEETKENLFEGVFADIRKPTPEEERDFWNGIGLLEIYVTQSFKDSDGNYIFEFDVIDYEGCVGGIQEAIGIDYLLTHIWCLQKELREGYTYRFIGITAFWTRGDGWSTDDDVDYRYEIILSHFNPLSWLLQKAKNIWWRNIGWRIAR